MQEEQRISSLTQANISLIFEGLCKLLTRAVVKENREEARKIKGIIIRGIKQQDFLKEELELYRAIAQSNFSSKDTNKAYISELLGQYKKKNKEYLSEEDKKNISTLRQNKIGTIQEELKKHGILESDVIEFINHSPNYKLYSAVEKIVGSSLKEQSSTTSIQEAKEFYKALEVIQENAIKVSDITLKEALQKLRPQKKIPQKIFKNAIRIFEQRYKDILSESLKELLEDFLYYSKTDRFVTATGRRLRDKIVETKLYGKKTKNSEVLTPIIENMEACYNSLVEYSKNPVTTPDDKKLFGLIKEVSHHLDICDEIRKIS